MSVVQTTSSLSPRALAFYKREAIETARALLTYAKWGVKEPMKENTGKQINFVRYDKLAAATTPLTEGVTPVGNRLVKHEVTADLAQYGDWVGVSDVVTLVNFDPELTRAVKELGEQEGLTIDTILRDALLQGTNEVFANKKTARTAVADTIQKADIQKIVRAFESNNVKKITAMINPSTGVATQPIEPAYIAIGHTDLRTDLENLKSVGFVPVHEYASQSKVFEGEVGKLCGVRFILTSNAPVFAGAGTTPSTGVQATGNKTDVYAIVIFGRDAYAEVPLNKASSGVIIKAKTKNDTYDSSDPLNQRNTAAWKCMYSALILDDTRLARYECGVSE